LKGRNEHELASLLVADFLTRNNFAYSIGHLIMDLSISFNETTTL